MHDTYRTHILSINICEHKSKLRVRILFVFHMNDDDDHHDADDDNCQKSSPVKDEKKKGRII